MEQIWWERVPNALSFVNDIVTNLLDEKSVVIQYSTGLPWQSFFSECVKDSVKQKNSSKTFEMIPGAEVPGSYLLREFCKPEKRAQYRPSKSYACFLAESDDIVLHKRYLWVKIGSAQELDNWSSFIADYQNYRNKSKEPAVFILDWLGREQGARRKGLTTVSFDDYIGEYDRIVFSMLASSAINERTFIKDYLAELAASLIGNDIELYSECIHRYKRFMTNPFDTIQECVTQSVRSDGERFGFCKTQEEVKHCVWMAQIRTVYPIIEEYRENIIQKHYSAIKAQLPITNSYGEELRDPADIELGTLVYMVGSKLLTLSNSEYEKLAAYKEARNKLSHLGTLSLDEITFLLG